MKKLEDTIAAISTPAGSGGIAVLRLSGPRAIEIVAPLFNGAVKLIDAESHKAYIGNIPVFAPEGLKNKSNEKNHEKYALFDEVIVTVFRAPRSYTREDVVEISCHGGYLLSRKILEKLIDRGARLAEPGEFTKRAFLNGRFDLNQAEAVGDIIQAASEMSLKSALSQFQGALSNKINKLRKGLIEACSLIELELDFAEEDLVFPEFKEIENKIYGIKKEIKNLLDSYLRGRILRDGAKLVIVGKPNVGKSSLLNALLKIDRAIVTEIPGTTRDVLEESLNIRGFLFRAVDTAGVRETQNVVEKEGVNRTLNQVENADIVLVLFDASQKIDSQDVQFVERIGRLIDDSRQFGQNVIAVLNKIDLPQKTFKNEVIRRFGFSDTLEISAKELLGFNELEQALVKKAFGKEKVDLIDPLVSNIRQKQALENAAQALILATQTLKKRMSAEFVAVDVRDAIKKLDEIIGEVSTEEILGNIFENFCIGK
ncbi:MAG: tRNA uridine-5-carboxymethylaminomethyl(34) synthesis GTPase MnmE [bacterium]